MKTTKTWNVLVVEDQLGDVHLIKLAIESWPEVVLYTVPNAVQARQFVLRKVPFGHVPTPDLILLDLNLPRLDGREVLTQIKTDPKLRMIPIIILSTSDAESDVLATYELHANCYIGKPAQWDQFESLMRSTMDFWLQRVRLPLGGVEA